MTALVAVLEACAGGSTRLLADPVASAFYWTLTRALRLLMPEVFIASLQSCLAPSVAQTLIVPAPEVHSCSQQCCCSQKGHHSSL